MRETAPAVHADVYILSDCGSVREENQDAGAVWQGAGNELALVVADGMGGHVAGREAAETVVSSCLEVIRSQRVEPWCDVLRNAVAAAQAAVLEDGGGDGSRGATVVLAVLDWSAGGPWLYAAHVGDSRVYLRSERGLHRLTDDHSLVAQMVRDGLLSDDEAFDHPDRNVIQRAIGQRGALEPDVRDPVALHSGDVVLACSDGLHGTLPDGEIANIIDRSADAEEICRSLLVAALAAGSADNITIGCARIVIDARHPRRTDVGTVTEPSDLARSRRDGRDRVP